MTAEEFLDNNSHNIYFETATHDEMCIKAMVEFAKLKVDEALEAAWKTRKHGWTNSENEEVQKDLFKRNAYSLEKIK